MPKKTKHRLKKRNIRRNKTRKQNKKIKKMRQKIYKMIGCNKQCNCACHHNGGSYPIGGLSVGGSSLVGSPYSIETGGNYYELPKSNAYDNPTAYMKLRGGNILPDNLVNVGRQMVYGAQSVYNGLAGYKSPTDPAPYVQNKL